MSEVGEQFDQLQQKFGGLNKRVKRMVIAGLFALVYAVLDVLLIQPLMEEYSEVSKAIEKAKSDSKKFAANMMNLQNQFGIDPTLSDQEQVDAMGELLQKVETDIVMSSAEFVSPDQMIAFINELLRQSNNVSLQYIKKLPVDRVTVTTLREDIKIDEKPASKKPPVPAEPTEIAKDNVYRYSVEIGLKGNYLDILSYAQKVENLPWRVFWEAAEFDASVHAETSATFNIYTISLDEYWLTL